MAKWEEVESGRRWALASGIVVLEVVRHEARWYWALSANYQRLPLPHGGGWLRRKDATLEDVQNVALSAALNVLLTAMQGLPLPTNLFNEGDADAA